MLYKEISKFNTLFIWSIWLFIILFISLTIHFYYEIENSIYILFLIITILLLLIFSSLYFTKLVLTFNDKYIGYKFHPYINQEKKIYFKEIKRLEIIKIDPISDFGGWGCKKSNKYGQGFITNSNTILYIENINGVKTSFSITNLNKIEEIIFYKN
jgi:hypothetical protein